MLVKSYAEAAPGARSGLILFVQSFGDFVNFNPHLHVLAADGAFLPDCAFVALPPVPEGLLAESFRCAVLEFLTGNKAIPGDLRAKLLGWRHFGGFSAHKPGARGGRGPGRPDEARRLYAPGADVPREDELRRGHRHGDLPLEDARGAQEKLPSEMPAAEWLALLYKHIPDRYEHLVRYVGWYSNRARGERAKALKA